MAHGGLLLGIVISGVRILEDQSPVSSAVETCMAGPSFLLLVVYIYSTNMLPVVYNRAFRWRVSYSQ